MPEYDVTVIERQTSERTGVRRITADTPDAAQQRGIDEPDDNATSWGDWEHSSTQMRADEDRPPVLVGARVETVLAEFADSDQAEVFQLILKLSSTTWGDLEVGFGLHKNDLYLFLGGVPINMQNQTLRQMRTDPDERGLLIHHLLMYVDHQDPSALGHLIDTIDRPSCRQLAAFLAGERNGR